MYSNKSFEIPDNNYNSSVHQYVVIEGPIGVGKTDLASKLAHTFGAELELENATANPFIKKFYENPQDSALPAQLFFLFQRYKRMKSLMQKDMFAPNIIADYLIDKDRLFAKVTLGTDEFELYDQVYQQMTIQNPEPDLVVYLQAPAEVLIQKVSRRFDEQKMTVPVEYLKKIIDAYTEFFYYYSASPLLIVNASGIDLINNEVHYNELLGRIRETQAGRHYFNPKDL